VRRSRDRFKSDDLHDRDAARRTTGWVLMQLSKLIAPFMPFLADDLYVRLPISGKKESVHLEEWPAMGVSASSILDEMEAVRAVVSLALEVRAKAGIKVRQPLALLESGAEVLVGKQELLQIIADEVNVKEVVITPGHAGATLDTTITPALKEDGQLRDILRHVQDLRKKEGLDPQDRVTLSVAGTEKLLTLIHNREDELKKSAGISAVRVEEVEGSISVEIDDLVLRIGIAKIL
jgi:isoleucyl-tRNA synthetase